MKKSENSDALLSEIIQFPDFEHMDEEEKQKYFKNNSKKVFKYFEILLKLFFSQRCETQYYKKMYSETYNKLIYMEQKQKNESQRQLNRWY